MPGIWSPDHFDKLDARPERLPCWHSEGLLRTSGVWKNVPMQPEIAALIRPDGLLALRVTPKASADCIVAEPDAEGGPRARVHVTAAPEDGKANRAVVTLVAKALGVAKSRVTLVRGATSRDKLVRIVE